MGEGTSERDRGGLVKWIDLNGRFSVNLESGFPKKKKKQGSNQLKGWLACHGTLIVHYRGWSLRWSAEGGRVRYTNIHEAGQRRYQSANESVFHRC